MKISLGMFHLEIDPDIAKRKVGFKVTMLGTTLGKGAADLSEARALAKALTDAADTAEGKKASP